VSGALPITLIESSTTELRRGLVLVEEPITPSRENVLLDYQARLKIRQDARARWDLLERVITEGRLVLFVLALVFVWLIWGAGKLQAVWLLLPVGLFVVLVMAHAWVTRSGRDAERAVEFYEKGIARVEERWSGKGETGDRFLDTEHPYAADLDLFGVGSLFDRICTARTRAGEDTLADWLLAPASPEVVRARQVAVQELRPRVQLREELELLGADIRAGIDPVALAEWGRAPRVFKSVLVPLAAFVLAALTVFSLFAWELLRVGPTPFLGLLLVELVFAWSFSGLVHKTLGPLDRRAQELGLLSHLLKRLEHEPFQSELLRKIQTGLARDAEAASHRIARLARLLQCLEAQKNQLFAPLGGILLWSIQFAFAIDAWRGRSGPEIAGWLAAIGEFEALCSLASYSWENPADVFPEIIDEGAEFDAKDLGHPLLPLGTVVRNDLAIGGELRLIMVSGSNMSGKSTLLRSVGLNTVLALAGAPVRAASLRLTPLAVGATLRVQDSLQAGRSRFYAEITRLRQLVDLSRGPIPLLFLIDEILSGTNSHDRSVGGESLIRGLVNQGAIGFVTTHDLVLAEIADRLGDSARNVHFVDHLEGETLHFDYQMRPGVVRKSNALALMRAVGLEV